MLLYRGFQRRIVMTKEEYLKYRKKIIIEQVNKYNKNNYYPQFKMNENNFDIKETFCSPEYCKGCGNCCHNGPCVYSPRDFLDVTSLDYMRRILDTGVVTIVSYNIYTPLIIRNRGRIDAASIACDDGYYNPCILHTEKGCMLPEVYRASGGLLFVKNKYGHIAIYSEEDYLCKYENLDYQDSLHKLYEEYKDVIIPQELITEEKVEQFIKSLIRRN